MEVVVVFMVRGVIVYFWGYQNKLRLSMFIMIMFSFKEFIDGKFVGL